MKTIILLFILTSALFSSENYELKLYQNLLPTLFRKESLHIYTQDIEKINLFKQSTLLKISDNCSDADLIIGKNFDELSSECSDKPIFATSYRSFEQTKNAFGAFYWRKGRPQIQFKSEEIQRYHLYLPPNLSRYVK